MRMALCQHLAKTQKKDKVMVNKTKMSSFQRRSKALRILFGLKVGIIILCFLIRKVKPTVVATILQGSLEETTSPPTSSLSYRRSLSQISLVVSASVSSPHLMVNFIHVARSFCLVIQKMLEVIKSTMCLK